MPLSVPARMNADDDDSVNVENVTCPPTTSVSAWPVLL